MVSPIPKTSPRHLIGLSLGTFALAGWNGATVFLERHQIHPYTQFGWSNEQYGISIVFAFLAALLPLVARRSSLFALGVTWLIALSSCILFSRFFWMSLALLAVWSLISALLLAAHTLQTTWVRRCVILATATSLCAVVIFVAMGLVLVGE